MKISLIAKSSTGWHQQDLARAARERGVEFEVVDFMNVNQLARKSQRLGDAVIWRAASGIDLLSERASAALYFGDRPVMNRAVFERPFITYKYYQQALFAKRAPRFKGITTYRAANHDYLLKLLVKGKLQYPFIVKPNLGSKGKGIIVIEREEQLAALKNHGSYVFQNFIKNKGDYRVIVVGGRALGVMRRIAKKGSYLNNISQGATAVNEVRPQTREAVIDIALAAASVFGLAYCGVDILEDSATGELHFMEINTAPQWNGEFGFASITGVDVAAAIVDLAIDLADRVTTPAATLVQRYYDKHIVQASRSKTMHYASRLYLWTGDQHYRMMLDEAEAEYIGGESVATQERLRKLFNGEALIPARIGIPARTQYFEKYPELQPANRMLFKSLFARTLYSRNVDAVVGSIISNEQLLDLFNRLVRDHDAVRVLSTFALNYFYLLKAYFRDDLKLANLVLIEPKFIEELLSEYETHEAAGEITHAECISLQVYLVTHAIIGESQFYNRMVTDEGYQRLLALNERLIQQNYFDISVDCKVEFLVCCRLTGYQSVLNDVILQEAEKSLSPIGNYLIDVYNTESRATLKNRMTKSEHRSVLFLMASLPFRKAELRPSSAPSDSSAVRKQAIGRMAQVDFPEQGILGVKARVDSGAYFSSVHATDISENIDGTLSFTLLGGYHDSIQGMRVTVHDYKKRPVKNTSGRYQDRYVVVLRTTVLGQQTLQTFTLANRQNMAAPVLLGRTFLKTGYVVDVSRQFA